MAASQLAITINLKSIRIVKFLRSIIKRSLPPKFFELRSRFSEIVKHKKYSQLSVDRVFAQIYRNKEWGNDGEFYSGTGSHDLNIITPYIREIGEFLRSFEKKPTIVDLGAGDFNVGKHFVDFAGHYYACDIVPELQQHNKRRFSFPNVDFLCLNAVEDELPDGEVVFIRQVLQHLSNMNIKKIIDKCSKYRWWVITEHLPMDPNFSPNKDITNGCGIRMLLNSGVILTEKPFNVSGYSSRTICEADEYGGVIRTTLFERQLI